ncbi:protein OVEREXPRESSOR OF CATIONIC PEROXIDASE 3 [Ziziphus jujuba]|uniref:Protein OVEREXPRESSOR OF CATIONIC PEROXIDASE 3 n=1 Tax=Ziziphus jujuba TaxID=326968 RepID=A0ABM3INN0_ZIZJJ|nr:protein OVEREXPRESSOR OF CATIONIC PEROXIDASE 3 [Ziziphus jujuba]XP_060673612.1 protein OVEREXPRESSOR OF CATIONIC PEROXIDASE 3 [Ziziphus jujuba]
MGLASAVNSPPMALRSAVPLPNNHPRPPSNLYLPLRRLLPRFSSTLTLARRRNHHSATTTTSSPTKKKNKQSLAKNRVMKDEDDIDEDAFEALFSMLEEDLKKDDVSLGNEDDEDIREEDLALLEEELSEAFGADGDFSLDTDNEDGEDDEDEDEEEEEPPVKLKNWQLRRLASALKAGRRKTSIKSLAAELCLDRALVLELLREPPPSLLMMSAALPDEPPATVSVTETKPVETVAKITADTAEPDTSTKVPVHVLQQKFSAQKRLKKVHVQTLESVYRRTKRPTNAMISSIVHVTNLPRKRVIKWFEDKRAEDEVPENRTPYQRSSVSS